MSKNYTKVVVTSLPARMVEIFGEISPESMSMYRDRAIQSVKSGLEIDGFRKGAAPDAMVVRRFGDLRILEEAAEMALNVAYPEILENEKIDAIGRPEITITKIALGNALEFKISTAIVPKVELADYKNLIKTASDSKISEVTEKEIDAVVLNLRKDVAHARFHEKNDEEGKPVDHNHDEVKEEDLPEVDEEFLKIIGGSGQDSRAVFGSVEDLRSKIRESLVYEKETKAKDKRRTDLLEKIIAESTIELPDIVVQSEIEKMLAQFKDDIARAGAKYEDYLKHIKKSEEDLKKEWRDTAEKRAQSLIVLSRIAIAENLTPNEEDIKREMDKILSQDQKLERFRVRMFVENFLSNEMVFSFLEQARR